MTAIEKLMPNSESLLQRASFHAVRYLPWNREGGKTRGLIISKGLIFILWWVSKVSIHKLRTVVPRYGELSSTGLSYAPCRTGVRDLSRSTFLWLRFTTLLCTRYSIVRSCSPTCACTGELLVVVAWQGLGCPYFHPYVWYLLYMHTCAGEC